MRDFAVGFALGLVVMGLGLVLYHQNKKAEIDQILSMSEQEFLSSEQKIRDAGGIHSKTLSALLSCVQMRKEKQAELVNQQTNFQSCQAQLGIAQAEIETLKSANISRQQDSPSSPSAQGVLGPFDPSREKSAAAEVGNVLRNQINQKVQDTASESSQEEDQIEEVQAAEQQQQESAAQSTAEDSGDSQSLNDPAQSTEFLEFDYLPRQQSVSCEGNMNSWFVAGEGVDDYRLQVRHDKKNTIATISSIPNRQTRTLELNRCGDLAALKGKRVLFKTSIKLKDVTGDANLHIYARDKSGNILRKKERRLLGTFRWMVYRVRMTVPKNTDNLVFGISMASEGTMQVRKASFGLSEQ